MSGRGAISDVPFLPEVRIERDAESLIAEYAQRRRAPVIAPVPVEDILELHLGLTFAIEDLAALFGTDGVLGAIWFNEKLVRIDARLDPSENPLRLGRYRFTLAHEIQGLFDDGLDVEAAKKAVDQQLESRLVELENAAQQSVTAREGQREQQRREPAALAAALRGDEPALGDAALDR